MNYSQKVKECKPFFDMMSKLTEDNYMEFMYAGKKFRLSGYVGYKGEMSYSVWNGVNGMNVSKVGRTSLSLYTYDMMSQKTTYTLDVLKVLKAGSICVINKEIKEAA